MTIAQCELAAARGRFERAWARYELACWCPHEPRDPNASRWTREGDQLVLATSTDEVCVCKRCFQRVLSLGHDVQVAEADLRRREKEVEEERLESVSSKQGRRADEYRYRRRALLCSWVWVPVLLSALVYESALLKADRHGMLDSDDFGWIGLLAIAGVISALVFVRNAIESDAVPLKAIRWIVGVGVAMFPVQMLAALVGRWL